VRIALLDGGKDSGYLGHAPDCTTRPRCPEKQSG
jgi:hypothetical protein